MDLGLFFGRFHPILVHLPIGFLLLAVLLEAISKIKKEYALADATKVALLVGVLASAVSIFSGLALSSSGGYLGETLNLHKWLGISVGVISLIIFFIKSGFINFSGKVYHSSLVVLVILITTTGHFGGVLTHGEGYLVKYGPEFLQNIFGNDNREKKVELPAQPDSLIVYEHLIEPILSSNCYSCHNDNKLKGGLNLTSAEHILAGGDNGEVVSDEIYESELFKRVILPSENKKAMPPGKPLTYNEVSLLAYWIKTGASFEEAITAHEIPQNITNILESDFNYDPKKRPYWEMVTIEPVSDKILDDLRSNGFNVSVLGEENNLLDVGINSGVDSLTLEHWNLLESISNHITWLDLSYKKINDTNTSSLSKFKNLTRLKLHSNPITDATIKHLENLNHLESLNVYETQLTDEAVSSFEKIRTLKRVFLWKTEITEDGIQRLKEGNEDIEVVLGFTET